MTIQAKDLKTGMTVKFGDYGQWLTITKIDSRLQKNGKEVVVLTGNTERVVQKIKGLLRPIISEAKKDYKLEFKSLTKVQAL